MNAIQALDIRLTPRQLMERYQAYRAAIEPLIRIQCNILATCVPTIIRHGDGHIERVSNGASPEQQAMLDEIDHLKANVLKYFMPVDTALTKHENPGTTNAQPA